VTLWRLEWLRLVRTRRIIALVGVFLFFGFLGPLTARYLGEILERFGGEVQVTVPPPVPADGVTQYMANAGQIGLLVVVFVASAALAFDARREMAIFLRTRTPGVATILLPAFVVTAGAAVGSFALGALAAWYESVILIGPLPAGRMLVGMGLSGLFIAFAVAITALGAALTRSVLAAAAASLVALLGMAVIGNLGPGGRWFPTHLAGALDATARATPASEFLPAAGVAIVVGAAAVAGSVGLMERREL
jgi:ABC-2 type transport system permease protein